MCNMEGPACWGFCPAQYPTTGKPQGKSHTEISISYKADWPIRSGFLLVLITYIAPLSLSTLAIRLSTFLSGGSLHVASSVICAEVAEGVSCFLEHSCSHRPSSPSCLVDLPILPAWPISVLLKYMIDRIQTILLHQERVRENPWNHHQSQIPQKFASKSVPHDDK